MPVARWGAAAGESSGVAMRRRRLASVCLLALLMTLLSSPAAKASVLPSGFQESIVFSGLVNPTNIEFARDGRIFVAQKNGQIKVFDSPADPTPDLFADLSASVHDFSIDALNIAVTLNPGESGEVTINAPAGTYEYYCSIPGHKAAGMVGTLTVE